MNLKSCTETSANRRKLEIEIDAESFAKACDAAYHKVVRKINVPGFRKGKAPKSMIDKLYGKEFLYEDAINELYPEALEAAIKEAELEYVDDKIDLDVLSVGEEGLVFTAEVTVKPEVKMGEYKGIKVTRSVAEVTDEQVDAAVEQKREQNARLIEVEDRAAENGDTAVFDFAGYVDDVAFEGGTAENYTLELGSGNFIPGFEEQMVGHSIGEEFDVNVTFPEEYHAEELAGKPAVFKIKLHALKKRELPVVDDEWVTEISEFDTVDEYKADIRKNLTEQAEQKAKAEVDDKLIEALIDMLDAEIPEAMFERRIDFNVQEFAYRLQAQGLTMENYLGYLGMQMDDVREQMRPNA
ncbi:MAG: trigger factor, partial [Clostridia bacterium]|nr:trigger factor [Clostridia bacterium]